MIEEIKSAKEFKATLEKFIKKLQDTDESLYEELAEYDLNNILGEVEEKIYDLLSSLKEQDA